MKIGIIIGSTRQGRNGVSVGEWVAQQTAHRTDATYELIDLAEYNLPLLWEAMPPAAANGNYEAPETQKWSEKIAAFDGFVFVTPEYNHSVPAAMKNAVDILGPEWGGKAVTFVSYGADGGVRAVEHWRQILANLSVQCTRGIISLGLFTDFVEMGQGGFHPGERRAGELDNTLGELERLTQLLRPRVNA